MNKLKKVKIYGFLAALVTVFGIAGSQSTTKAIFFSSVHEKGDLNAAYSAAKASPGNVELWRRVAELAEREVRILEATKADQAQIANARTDEAYAKTIAGLGGAGWGNVLNFAEREIIVLGATGDSIQLASAKTNAAFAKANANPENVELWTNAATLAEREVAAWKKVENQTNAGIAKANAVSARVVIAFIEAQLNPHNVGAWENAAALAEHGIAAFEAIGDKASVNGIRVMLNISRAIVADFRVKEACTEANAAAPDNVGAWENAAGLAEHAIAAFEAIGDRASVDKIRVVLNTSRANVADFKLREAYTKANADQENLGAWENVAALAGSGAKAWEADGKKERATYTVAVKAGAETSIALLKAAAEPNLNNAVALLGQAVSLAESDLKAWNAVGDEAEISEAKVRGILAEICAAYYKALIDPNNMELWEEAANIVGQGTTYLEATGNKERIDDIRIIAKSIEEGADKARAYEARIRAILEASAQLSLAPPAA
jgi:hypothetical protein